MFVLAHPVTEAVGIGVAPAFVAFAVGVVLVLLAAGARSLSAALPRAGSAGSPAEVVGVRAADDRTDLDGRAILGRTIGAGLLLLAVVAGRFGDPDELDNIATALVIGAGWPLLLLTSLVVDLWGWLSPFDGVARVLERLAGDTSTAAWSDRSLDRIAVVGALGWTWWLAAYQPGLQPRAIGLVLGAYALLTWTGCLVAGRTRWLSRAEVFTVLFTAIATARRSGRLGVSPMHASVLAVLLGGLVVAELRFSRWFLADVARLGIAPFSEPATVLGYLAVVGLASATVRGSVGWARRTGADTAVLAMLPFLVVGAGLAAAVERDRLWTSAQLLLVRASNPFGGSLDLFGTAQGNIYAWPHTDVTRLVVQVLLLVLPVAVGLVKVARRGDASGRPEPLVALVLGWVVVATMSAATL